MLFNSIAFAIFLPIVFFLYWFVTNKNLKLQNIVLLVASYYFYACWNWRFLFLLIFSTLLDYYTGIKIHDAATKKKKRYWLCLSVIVNLGFLGVFKYYNFFAASFADGLSLLGIQANLGSLNVILPVGISFYTFHGLSYVFDLYNDKIKPERNFVNYADFVCFFPLLVAGPIERATHLLPQIIKKREFDYSKAVEGLRQILWGLFKKIVIADNCAVFANDIFSHSASYPGSTLFLGAIFFAFQIYCDFSGYSDIALGTARLFGIELLRNFNFPYFSRDIAEFWRRWHISLTTWFRDYLYIPMGGSRSGLPRTIFNTFVVFVISGFWHGANWTFITWGAFNAFCFLPLLIFNRNRQHLETVATGHILPTISEFFKMMATFTIVVFGWIIFRAQSITQAFQYIGGIFSRSLFSFPDFPQMNNAMITLVLIGFLLMMEWIGREEQFAIAKTGNSWPRPFRWAFYAAMVFAMTIFMQTHETPFIYFQF